MLRTKMCATEHCMQAHRGCSSSSSSSSSRGSSTQQGRINPSSLGAHPMAATHPRQSPGSHLPITMQSSWSPVNLYLQASAQVIGRQGQSVKSVSQLTTSVNSKLAPLHPGYPGAECAVQHGTAYARIRPNHSHQLAQVAPPHPTPPHPTLSFLQARLTSKCRPHTRQQLCANARNLPPTPK
jgi:hypothetical protein